MIRDGGAGVVYIESMEWSYFVLIEGSVSTEWIDEHQQHGSLQQAWIFED